jgi:hypothetical protein
MALANLAALRAALASPTQTINQLKSAMSPFSSRFYSSWTLGGTPSAGAAPTAGAIPTRATAGALGQNNRVSAGDLRAVVKAWQMGQGTPQYHTLMLVDRVVHMGGLSGTNVGAQAVNTPALTRYTDGVGVRAMFENYATFGTAVTLTITYDSDNGTGHVSQPIDIVAASGIGIMQSISLALGDRGVKAVTSAQLSGSSGTVGNFGLTLIKPLGIWSAPCGHQYSLGGDPIKTGSLMSKIEDDACLQFIAFSSNTTTFQLPVQVAFFES